MRNGFLIVLVGPPGSGKTTWAKRNQFGAVHISQDDLIDAITPAGFDHIYRPVYYAAEDAAAHAALRDGHVVIVDRTNRTRVHRRRWLEIANQENSPAIAVVMSTSDELCRERNARRDGVRRLSEERIDRMLAALEPVQSEEGFVSIHIENGIGEGITLEEILDEHRHQVR